MPCGVVCECSVINLECEKGMMWVVRIAGVIHCGALLASNFASLYAVSLLRIYECT